MTKQMNTTIENLYIDFRSNYKNRPGYFMYFVTKHSLFFNNLKNFKNKEDLRLYIEIISKYVEAVYLKDRCNEAIDLVNKYQNFIDNEIEHLNAEEVKDDWYHSLDFVKAMAYYKLREYKKSTRLFKELTEIDKKNDIFKNWLTHSKFSERIWLLNIISVICALIIITDIFFREEINNYIGFTPPLKIAFVILIAIWGIEFYLKRSLRKKTIN